MNSHTHTFIYYAFVVRLWREGEAGAWRATLQEVQTGEKHFFTSLERLCLYLLTLDETAPSL